MAGATGLDRDIRWAHVIDMPEPAPWVRPGQLLLTTGFAWPDRALDQRRQIRLLDERGLAAMALAVPRYRDHFSDDARAEADRCGLPLLEIPFDVPFAQITEELHRMVIAEQYSLIGRSEEIHRALTRAAARSENLNDLARSLGELIGRTVIFEDPGGKLLAAYVCAGSDDVIARETIIKAHSPAVLRQAMERLGLLKEMRAAGESSARIPAMPQIGLTARVACPIRLGSELVGLVWIVEGEAALSELDNRAAEHAALIAAVQVAHQRQLETTEARLGYASFLSLLEAEADDAQTVERARLLGFEPEGLHRVGIAVIPEPLPLNREAFLRRELVAGTLRAKLTGAGARPLLAPSLNYVAFLLPDGIDARVLWQAGGDDEIAILVGRPHAGTHGLRRSYREALSLLNYRDGQSVRFFEDALVPRVLMGDPGAREAFVDDLFGALAKRKGGATLRGALLAFARAGFNFKETARKLQIHQNTLRYRLGRAVEWTHLDLAEPENRFRLQLAAHLLDFAHNETGQSCAKPT
ncbi:MAG: PucR family transcriptional regulator ligand-binding domain-containing protein [Candidatus Eremiobacteraeota bacterium]|nr:PucR family transcriptional regulator ligand-binding domain-containing protein [Candidatus Eremiobacteraeota bacterium]